MQKVRWILMFAVFLGCAHGKMGTVDQKLEKGTITKTTPIYVEQVTTDNMTFSGDKAQDAERTAEEKAKIKAVYHMRIVKMLQKKGYNAKTADGAVKDGVVVRGNVRMFDHGSGAKRAMIGFGAGSSNMYTDFKIENGGKTVSKFEVIGTSGGRAGLASMGSFLEGHLDDSAEKVAEYIAGE